MILVDLHFQVHMASILKFQEPCGHTLLCLYVCNTMEPMDKHTYVKGWDKPTCSEKRVSIDAAKYFQLKFLSSEKENYLV